MPPVKQALIRCENLDLFAAPATIELAPTLTNNVAGEDTAADPLPLPALGPDDQLDLFLHSPSEIAAAEARRALKQLSAERAREKLALLRQAPGYAPFVADCERCLALIERHDPRWVDAAHAVQWIEAELWPAAERCLQHDAPLLVRPALLALLDRVDQATFDACRRHAHPAYLWQLLEQPAQAVAALELDPHWRDHTEALVWHAELSEQAGLHERVHADIAELCLGWPEAAENWLSTSREWSSRWSAWCDLDDVLPIHAFPAWARLTRASDFPLPTADDQRPGAELLRIADRLARNASDLPLRKALSALNPALLAAFLAARATRTG